jgi:hypothetical protein
VSRSGFFAIALTVRLADLLRAFVPTRCERTPGMCKNHSREYENEIALHNGRWGDIYLHSNAKGADYVHDPNNHHVGWSVARCGSSIDG